MNQDSEIKNVTLDEAIKITSKALKELKKSCVRPEEVILKDFNKLGYEVKNRKDYTLLAYKDNNDLDIILWHIDESYATREPRSLNMQEHKLLNELFICWGWL